MRLIRFEAIDENGKVLGIAHDIQDGNLSIDEVDQILYLEEYLPIPNPYPSNTKAYFTVNGLHLNKELIKLYIKRCVVNNLKVKTTKTWINKGIVKYQDNEQVLLLNKKTKGGN